MEYNYLKWLQEWYKKNCEEWVVTTPPSIPWQEDRGVTIESMDNPGWSVGIHISGTDIDDIFLPKMSRRHSEDDWIDIEIGLDGTGANHRIFKCYCDPDKLGLAIHIFKLLTERNTEEISRIMKS